MMSNNDGIFYLRINVDSTSVSIEKTDNWEDLDSTEKSMIIRSNIEEGLFTILEDDAFLDDFNHPRYFYASRCVRQLETYFPRLKKYFDNDQDEFMLKIHQEDYLYFKMLWEIH